MEANKITAPDSCDFDRGFPIIIQSIITADNGQNSSKRVVCDAGRFFKTIVINK